MRAQPYVCEKCGQRGDERPGFKIMQGLPEAVWTDDGPVVLEHIKCLKCEHTRAVAAGSIEVRKPTT